MIGKTIGRYNVIEKLGEGGMGSVWKAEDTKLNRFVAIKILSSHLAENEEARERFIREAQAATALNHPNITTVYDLIENESQYFICMEYVDGQTFSEMVKSGNVPVTDAVDYITQTADALQAAHSKGILHRDVKSANIMVNTEGRVKVMDFGLAHIEELSHLTIPGTTLGTISYSSPEQITGQNVNEQSEIFSLGVVFYELLTGAVPFRGKSEAEIVFSIINDEPERVSQLREDLPGPVEAVAHRMLEKEPARRYSTCQEIFKDLKAIYTELEAPTSLGRYTGLSQLKEAEESIAVLPFANRSADPENEYFSDGMAEVLMNRLVSIPGLRVAARTSSFSFKGKQEDIRSIGNKLKVGHVLDGSVQRSGDRIRITVQLVKVSDGFQLWSDTYDRDWTDIFQIQDEISHSIVEALKPQLVGEIESAGTAGYLPDPEAHDLYLKGLYFWNQRGRGLAKSLEFFNQSIQIDPEYALAYVGIAEAYTLLTFYGTLPPMKSIPAAKEAAEKALSIDDSIAEVYSVLGFVRTFFDWDLAAADQEFHRALELNPNYAPARYWYATYLTVLRRFEDSFEQDRIALKIDPFSRFTNTHMGWMKVAARHSEDAINQLQVSIELDETFALTYHLLGLAYEQLSRYEEAITAFRRSVECSAGHPWMVGGLGCAYGIAGEKEKADQILSELKDRAEKEYVRSYILAEVCSGLGRTDEALNWLGKAYEERDLWMAIMHLNQHLDSLKHDPRYITILEKVGIERYRQAQ